MMAVSKGAGTARLKAELEQTIEEKGLQAVTIVYTDGFVMKDRVGFSVIWRNKRVYSTLYTKGNSKKIELKDLLAEEGSNLRLMWVPFHMGIMGNERADKASSQGRFGLEYRIDNLGGQV
jgi:ribonuclease HI